MDPVTILVTALVAGAAAGGQSAATEAVKDGYAGLKALVERKLSRKSGAVAALEDVERDAVMTADGADAGQAGSVLEAEVRSLGAADDEAVAAAKELLEALKASGALRNGPQLDLRSAKGVQVGNGNYQSNTFN